MKVKFFLAFFLSLLVGNLFAAKTKSNDATDDQVAEFKGSKFLQIDKVSVPSELKKIEEQVRQNIIDVVLVSNTHTPIYSQKRDGYSESYKNFFGVQVRISVSPEAGDEYDVSYFYYNWTTNKSDKSLYKKISKYNVLNEVRFGMYELLLGKEYVKKNRDVIDIQNYERIQAVRKSIAEQERAEKKKRLKKDSKKSSEVDPGKQSKKKKLIRKDKEKEKEKKNKSPTVNSGNNPSFDDGVKKKLEQDKDPGEKEQDDKKSPSDTLKDKEKGKGKRKHAKNVELVKDNKDETRSQEENSVKPSLANDPNSLPSIKYKSELYGSVGPIADYTTSITSDNKIKTYSNFRYVGIGGSFDLIEERARPKSYGIKFQIGIPIMKGNYTIPIYKAIDLGISKFDLVREKSKVYLGVQYSPINFVNVPNFGEGLQVFENNFLWAKASLGNEFAVKKKPLRINLSAMLSLFGSSSQKKNLSGTKFEIFSDYMLSEKYGVAFSYQVYNLDGDFLVSGNSVHLQMLYKFEN